MKKTTKRRIAIISVLVIIILLFVFVPTLNNALTNAVSLLTSMDTTKVAEYIRSFGGWAVLVSFLLMILQSVVAPIPAFLITFANAAVFGWWQGAILSWTSSMAGAALCFGIARGLGRDVVEKLSGKKGIAQFERFFERYGQRTILVCRLLPFVSFDFISYGAGLTAMSFFSFFLATGIGQLPATLVYSYVGGMLSGAVKTVVTGLLLIFALFFMVSILKGIYNDKYKDKEAIEAVEGK